MPTYTKEQLEAKVNAAKSALTKKHEAVLTKVRTNLVKVGVLAADNPKLAKLHEALTKVVGPAPAA